MNKKKTRTAGTELVKMKITILSLPNLKKQNLYRINNVMDFLLHYNINNKKKEVL